MAASGIEAGAFVWDSENGLGRVDVDNPTAVLFWANKKSGKPTYGRANSIIPLPGVEKAKPGYDGFSAWANASPLTIAALGLSECGGSGTKQAILGKLKGKAPLPSAWWNRVQPKLDNLPGYFQVDGDEYTLVADVANVPPDASMLPAWKKWLVGGANDFPPETFPASEVAEALAEWPEESIERALSQTLRGAEQYLGAKPSAKPALGWMDALGQASQRWWKCKTPHLNGETVAQSRDVLIQLANVVGIEKSGKWLLWTFALSGGDDEASQRGFAAGMWLVSGKFGGNAGRNRRNLFRATAELLGRQNRADLAREIALAAFRDSEVTPRYSALDELDQILEQLTPGEEAKRLLELMALSSDAGTQDKAKLLNYVGNSRHAAGPERLNLLVAATLLLTDGTGPVAAQAAREIDRLLTTPDGSVPVGQALFRDAKWRMEGEVAEKVSSYNRLLEQERREQSQLHERVGELRNQLFSGYELSKLDIRHDMLVLIGELSQLVAEQDCPSESFVHDVRAKLDLALQAGDAKRLGVAGEIAKYDPKEHQTVDPVRIGENVKIKVPGVKVKGQHTEDRVLVRAQVSRS